MRFIPEVVIRSSRRLLLVPNKHPQICCFSLDYTLMSSSREARFMTKIMGRHESKKKMYFFDRVDSTPTGGGPRPYNQRRMAMLNKLFMKNITEVMATGSTASTVEGLGVEISKVEITRDFQIINVFYVCKKKPTPENLEQTLKDAGYRLRHELSQLRLMGEVPPVLFVLDKTLQRLDEIEELLSAADRGSEEDDSKVSEEINLLEEENLEQYNESQKAYGLNHTKILDKVMSAKRASCPNKRILDTITVEEGVPYSPSENVPPTLTERGRKDSPKQLISKFMRESKLARASNASIPNSTQT